MPTPGLTYLSGSTRNLNKALPFSPTLTPIEAHPSQRDAPGHKFPLTGDDADVCCRQTSVLVAISAVTPTGR